MMWFFLCACHHVDPELIAIKEKARTGDWLEVEQEYVAQINRKPDQALYVALAKVMDVQERTEVAQVMRMRAQSMSDISIWGAGVLMVLGLALWGWNRSRWSWIFVGSGFLLLAFYEDVRYKGTVLSTQANVFHTISDRGIPLFSLKKASVVGIVEEKSGYFLIEYENNRGWVKQNQILSWNPAHELQIERKE